MKRKSPDFSQFLKVLKRQERPSHLPVYEHVASPGFIAAWLGQPFDRMKPGDPSYWELYVRFWMEMGFDCVPMEIPLYCPLGGNHSFYGGHTQGSESSIIIQNRSDYERYPWPDESSPLDFKPYEIVASLLPPGAKIVGGVCAGPYEWVSWMLGTIGMSYLPEKELRAYVRRTIKVCFADGHWILGTGNSLPDYMPVNQYRIVLNEGTKAG